MSSQEQLAWPKPPAAASAADLRGGAPASKNRSPEPGPTDAEERGVVPPPTARDGVRAAADVYRPSSPPLTTRLVTSTTDFEALAPAWSTLLDEAVDANVFLSHEWLAAWWNAYRPQADLALVLVEDRGRLRGVAPLMIERRRRGGVTARVLRFVGDGTGETDHVNFVVARAERAAVMKRLLQAIDRLAWDVAEFNQIPQHSENAADLLRWLERQRLRPVVVAVACPVRRLPADAKDVLAALPGRLRTAVRSARRKLHERHRVEFGLHDAPDGLDGALERFFDNHASRWQGKGQAGAFADARRRAFYAALTPRLLARGWLRFFHLSLDGRVVAQQYCFALDGTVMLLQEGFDFAHAQDNVGNVLRAMVLEHLVAEGATSYDFLAGTSRHKASWSDATVHDLQIRAARRSWRGRLFHDLPLRWERVKDRLRPWRDRLLARRADAAQNEGSGGH